MLGRIRQAVSPLGGSAGCASALESSSGFRGPSPQAFTPFGGLGLLPGAWGAPNKGNPDEAEGIFGNARRVCALPCDRTHLKTALWHIVQWWDGW